MRVVKRGSVPTEQEAQYHGDEESGHGSYVSHGDCPLFLTFRHDAEPMQCQHCGKEMFYLDHCEW